MSYVCNRNVGYILYIIFDVDNKIDDTFINFKWWFDLAFKNCEEEYFIRQFGQNDSHAVIVWHVIKINV